LVAVKGEFCLVVLKGAAAAAFFRGCAILPPGEINDRSGEDRAAGGGCPPPAALARVSREEPRRTAKKLIVTDAAREQRVK